MAKATGSIKRERLIILPMNQYSQDSSVSALFGSPSGYIGSNSKPHLAKTLERFVREAKKDGNTFTYEVEDVVILFDEIEKAHSKVKQSLLTLLDEGLYKIQYTKSSTNETEGYKEENVIEEYRFKKSIFIATSNLFSREVMNIVQMRGKFSKKDFQKLNTLSFREDRFSPEFLSRFQKLILFLPIPKGDCFQTLLRLKLTAHRTLLKKAYACLSVDVENEKQVLTILENLLYEEGVDIRRVDTYFTSNVKQGIEERVMRELEDLSKYSIVLCPYNKKTLGLKIVGSILGKKYERVKLFQLQ